MKKVCIFLVSSYVHISQSFNLLGLVPTANFFLSFIYWCYILINLDRNRFTALLSGILLRPPIPKNCNAYKGSLPIFVINVSFPSLVYSNTLQYPKLHTLNGRRHDTCIFSLFSLASNCPSPLCSVGLQLLLRIHRFSIIHSQSCIPNCPSARCASINKVLLY
jgi:hypothetical protein